MSDVWDCERCKYSKDEHFERYDGSIDIYKTCINGKRICEICKRKYDELDDMKWAIVHNGSVDKVLNENDVIWKCKTIIVKIKNKLTDLRKQSSLS
jgi:hypothetical protein